MNYFNETQYIGLERIPKQNLKPPTGFQSFRVETPAGLQRYRVKPPTRFQRYHVNHLRGSSSIYRVNHQWDSKVTRSIVIKLNVADFRRQNICKPKGIPTPLPLPGRMVHGEEGEGGGGPAEEGGWLRRGVGLP